MHAKFIVHTTLLFTSTMTNMKLFSLPRSQTQIVYTSWTEGIDPTVVWLVTHTLGTLNNDRGVIQAITWCIFQARIKPIMTISPDYKLLRTIPSGSSTRAQPGTEDINPTVVWLITHTLGTLNNDRGVVQAITWCIFQAGVKPIMTTLW